jgi:hypothetical protein
MNMIPARDRLTLAMWGNSRDTGGMRRYNDVAKKYGMATLELPKSGRQKALEQAGIGPWKPTGRGGMGNEVTGEVNAPAEAAAEAEWVEMKDGRRMDRKTGQIEGQAQTEADWVELKDGRRMDRKTGSIEGEAAKPQGAQRYMNLGDNRVFDMDTGTYVKQDGTPDPRKDEFQGRIVKIKMGKDTYKVGIYDPKNGVYSGWTDNVKDGMTIQGPDGTSMTFGGGAGKDLSDVPDFVDRAVAGKGGTEGAAKIETRTLKDGTKVRVRKLANGQYEVVE